MRQFFNTSCSVYRLDSTLGKYNRPTQTEQLLTEYPCKMQKKNISNYQAQPQNITSEIYTLFLPTKADIKAGDVVVIHGLRYSISTPIPYRTYITFDIQYKGEL